MQQKNAYLNFGEETYASVKEVLKVCPTYRWLICSSIFAISSSPTTETSTPPFSRVGYISLSLPEKQNDQIRSLRNCKNLAEQDDLYHSAICAGKRN